MNKSNTTIILSTICTLISGISIAIASDNHFDKDEQTYQDRLKTLTSQLQMIIDDYAIDNVARTAFNGLKVEGVDFIVHKGKGYKIYNSQNKFARDAAIEAMPNDRAFISNFIGNLTGSLHVRSSEIDRKNNMRVLYSYTPGPLDRSGNTEYIFPIQPILTHDDQDKLELLTKEIHDTKIIAKRAINRIRQLKPIEIQDRNTEITPIIVDKLSKTKRSNNLFVNTFIQRIQHAKSMIYNDAQIVDNNRPARLSLNLLESTLISEKPVISNYQLESHKYRQFLMDSAKKLSELSEDIYDMHDSGIKPLQSQPIKKLIDFMTYYKGISSQYKNYSEKILGMNPIQQ